MELDLLMALQELHTPFLDAFFSHITLLGDHGILWILAGVILLGTRKYRKQGFLLLLSLLACLLWGNVLLKNLVARDRPCWLYPEIPLLIRNPWDYSFPSGHSMSGLAGATALFLTDRRLGIPALVLAVTIAFSRLYLFVHWPTDVLIGGVMGVAIACLVFYISARLADGGRGSRFCGSR